MDGQTCSFFSVSCLRDAERASRDSCTEPNEPEELLTEPRRVTPALSEGAVARAVARAERAEEALLITVPEGGEILCEDLLELGGGVPRDEAEAVAMVVLCRVLSSQLLSCFTLLHVDDFLRVTMDNYLSQIPSETLQHASSISLLLFFTHSCIPAPDIR